MLGNGWLTIRQAQEAIKNGRLEEAHRLLGQSAAQGHKGSWELLQQVALGFVQRGERHLKQDDTEAAWNGLLLAEQVGLADDSLAVRLRQTLTKNGLAELRAILEAGDPGRAVSLGTLLRGRSVRTSELQLLENVARDWVGAREQADRGEFTVAQQTVERLRRQLSDLAALERFHKELQERRERCTAGLVRLHEAVADGHWRKVVELADQVLSAAPQQVEARKARAQAWKVVEPPTVGVKQQPANAGPKGNDRLERFLLWIDGVGGYLVCLGNRVTIGQASPEGTVDVALFADISRHHATLTRDGGSYLIEAARGLQVNSQALEKAVVQPGDRMTLGTACQLQFSQPVPVSATARLDLASGHRLALAVDAVLLMADTLVLGPGSQVHIAIPDLEKSAVLFRQKDGIGIRYGGSFLVDGQRCQERGTLGPNSRVAIEDYGFSIESMAGRTGDLVNRR